MAEPFEAAKAPLHGPLLIDASAGTGKTQAIVDLYGRLLKAGFAVDRILAVTFTEAAARDLKRRVREDLKKHMDKDETGKLKLAFSEFERAAILTIHGFCRRVLRERAFESGSSFDAEVIADPTELLNTAAEDFYRLHFYECFPLFARFAWERNILPGTFRKIIALTLRNPDMELRADGMAARNRGFSGLASPERTSAQSLVDDFQSAAAAFQRFWTPALRAETRAWLLTAPLADGRTYGRMDSIDKKTGLSRREAQTETILAAAGDFSGTAQPSPFLPEKLKALSASSVGEHRPVFNLCETLVNTARALSQALEEHLAFLQKEAVTWGAKALSERKRRENIMTYDDLIAGVRAGLKSDGKLKERLREQYHAVLVDEFQDTDGAQFEIFDTLFGGGGTPLFLIGDPKQAIYTFRGGDVFTYFSAKKKIPAGRQFTLSKNFRSVPRIVASVNALFTATAHPFLLPQLGFEKALPHFGETPLRAGGENFPAFRFRFLRAAAAGGDPKRGLSVGVARSVIAQTIAGDIARLLESGLFTGEKALGPGDMTILVRTHKEAALQKQALASLSIPAVVVGEGSVFESPEARELLRLMEALLAPNDGGKIKAALASRLAGLTAAGLEQLNRDEPALSLWRERFRQLSETWRRGDFYPCLDRALALFETRERWSAGVENRRALANLEQLAESLQSAAARGLSPRALFRWLAERPFVTDNEGLAEKARLESDDPSVKIMTVHAAKGLQFPVVFCAFGLSKPVKAGGPLEFHDQDSEHRRVLFFPAESGDSKKSAACEAARSALEEEQTSEQLRLAYVGLTRAEYHCTFYWAHLYQPEGYPLSRLLHPNRMEGKGDWNDDALHEDLLSLRKISGEACTVEEIDPKERVPPVTRKIALPALHPPSLTGHIDRRWRVASFSSLAHAGENAEVAPADWDGRDESGTLPPLIPKGEKTGRFFHEVLCRADFAGDERAHAAAVDLELGRFFPGDVTWREEAVQTVVRALCHPLSSPSGPFRLSDVEKHRRWSEFAFYFPVKNAAPEGWRGVFTGSGTALPKNFEAGPGNLTFTEFQGFLHGFIDLSFEAGGKYYLLDWKSNFLGHGPEDYESPALEAEMVRRHYNLQSLIYTTAFTRHLAGRIPGFDYERHFGGVYYLFLRGLDPANPSNGVHFNRPPALFTERLSSFLQNG